MFGMCLLSCLDELCMSLLCSSSLPPSLPPSFLLSLPPSQGQDDAAWQTELQRLHLVPSLRGGQDHSEKVWHALSCAVCRHACTNMPFCAMHSIGCGARAYKGHPYIQTSPKETTQLDVSSVSHGHAHASMQAQWHWLKHVHISNALLAKAYITCTCSTGWICHDSLPW